MSLVSYAQNYEDIMLWRALGDIAQGFYVDVGAQDPVCDSVTRLFYERGWHGINIEPVEHWQRRLREDRPRDINLRMLATATDGVATIYEVPGTGLSTMDDSLAEQYRSEGRHVVPDQVECTRLDDVLAAHGLQAIHFLKIDVEGAEREVLAGLDLTRFRPWVIVIEARLPNSSIECHEEWESGVLCTGYRFVYQDGLNRYYLAEEHSQRASAFASPPNVLDGFIRYGEWEARTRLAGREVEVTQWQARAADLDERLEATQRLADARGSEVHAVVDRLADVSGRLEATQQLADGRAAELDAARMRFADLGERMEAMRQLAAIRAAELEEARGQAAELSSRLHAAQELAADRAALLVSARAELHLAQGAHEQKEQLLATILSSHSWKLTRPLRVLRRAASNGPEEILAALLRRSGHGFGQRLVSLSLRPFPALRERVLANAAHGMTGHASAPAEAAKAPMPRELPLSDRANEIRLALDQAWSDKARATEER